MSDIVASNKTDKVVVYLVDDDRGMVSSTSQWLALSGFKVRAFADPAALLRVIKPGTACLVVSDIRMPVIDGIELLKLIKGRDHRIPVILITGHGDIPLAVEAMKLGAYEFLQKPFSPEELLKTVQRAQRDYMKSITITSAEKDESCHSDTSPVSEKDSLLDVADGDLATRVEAYEKELICSTLERCNGSVLKAMEELAIPRRTLNAKMKKYGISRASFR